MSEPKRSNKREIRFLVTFLVLLGGGFVALSINAVNDSLVVPFTGLVAKTSCWSLDVIGQDVRMNGTQILSDRFAVDIKNGCNGLDGGLYISGKYILFYLHRGEPQIHQI